ncbi:MAG: amidohydrolase [Pseudonocardia sp. SCN 72-86]|nr:MAG: amidohydrolase [Pseudonocardia sp. SCN 72-86]
MDTDVHEVHASLRELLPYLEPIWHKYITDYGWQPDALRPHAQASAGGLDRLDSKLPDGRPGGSDFDLLKEQLLDEWNVHQAILTGKPNASGMREGWTEFKTALMSAYNDWEIENWVERDDRLFGSIHVNAWDAPNAVREIDRLAAHPKMVQVMLYIGEEAFGAPQYHPIFEAAERHGMVLGIHHCQNSPTALGYGRYYAEWHTLIPQVFMSQVISLIFNGVLDKYPNLKVNMIEGGFSYVPHLMWRADQQYRELRQEVPWVKRKPSDIIRDQVRFATQPVEEFTGPQLETLIGQMESDEIICFSTDYPHWDFDSPVEALPNDIPESLKRKLYFDNAAATYQRLPAKVTA